MGVHSQVGSPSGLAYNTTSRIAILAPGKEDAKNYQMGYINFIRESAAHAGNFQIVVARRRWPPEARILYDKRALTSAHWEKPG